jgi:hypothetical protein
MSQPHHCSKLLSTLGTLGLSLPTVIWADQISESVHYALWQCISTLQACTDGYWELEDEKLLGRPRRQWDDQIEVHKKVMTQDAGGVTSYSLEQVQLAVCCEHGHEPSGSIRGVVFSNQIF